MRWWDQQYKDPTYLATLTLGELGALLEFSVHNDMHLRWSALPRDPDTNAALPQGRPDDPQVSPKWDSPRYDTLLEFYSSHVHPVFWRLHGWIDDRIDDWYEAHERVHPGEVVRRRDGDVAWFAPGRWVQVADPWVWPAQSTGSHPGGPADPGPPTRHERHEQHGGHDEHGGHGGHGHPLDPEERRRRIESMEKVLAVLYTRETGSARRDTAAVAAPPDVFDPALKLPV